MKGVDWGTLYNKYKDEIYDTKAIEIEIAKLILDDDVSKKSGIYPYILTKKKKYLWIRAFTESTKQKVYENRKVNVLYVKNILICQKWNQTISHLGMKVEKQTN